MTERMVVMVMEVMDEVMFEVAVVEIVEVMKMMIVVVEVKVEMVIQRKVVEFVMMLKEALAQSLSHLCALNRELRLLRVESRRKVKVSERKGEWKGE